MRLVYNKVGLPYDIHVSKVNKEGIKILESK
jgi:homoserine kinase